MPPWFWLILILLLAAAASLYACAACLAWVLLRPPQMTDGKAAWVLKRLSPADLNLGFAPMAFPVHDRLTGRTLNLAAWWIPHPDARGRCVILAHGYGDAKVGSIAWAPLLHELGWNVLAYDHRAQGESEGRRATAAYHERFDLEQLIDQLRQARPEDARTIVLMGASFGATVVSGVATRRDDLAGVILESPYADYRTAAGRLCDLLGLPGPLVRWLALRLIARRTGLTFDAVSPAKLIPQIRCPVMVIHSGGDVLLTDEESARLEASVEERVKSNRPTAYWKVPGAPHLLALHADPELYRQRIREFLGML